MLIIQSSIAKPHYFCDEKKFKRIDSALPILVLLPFRLFTGNGLNWGKVVEQQGYFAFEVFCLGIYQNMTNITFYKSKIKI